MKEHAVTYIYMQHTILRKGCMLGELEGGGGGGSGRKIKRETERQGGREKGSEREIEEEGRTCSHVYVYTMCS